jgi:uncharacterized membrane protein YphA (DoxX/SURF4 family)/thioredoxin-related protein
MKNIVTAIRILVGVLFIFSGLVKANDPLGLSYKMQEFFEIWNAGLASSGFFLSSILISTFRFFHEHSLALSVLMIGVEIIAGAALLLGWRPKLVSRILFWMILFFSFLTAYAYFSGKFKNCGCFGDCLPITAKTSFLKDVVLTVLIIILLFSQKYILPVFSAKANAMAMTMVILFSFAFQWYTLNYLPVVDCLPFKVSNNIKEKMKIPAGAITDSFAIRFVYEKDGTQFEFSPAELPADLGSYKYIDRVDKQVRKGNAEPPIKGFALNDENNNNYTSIVLSEKYNLILFSENLSKATQNWKADLLKINAAAEKLNIPLYIVTTSVVEAKKVVANSPLENLQFFNCDFTAIRTAARSNPTLYILKEGTILNKWGHMQLKKSLKVLPDLK